MEHQHSTDSQVNKTIKCNLQDLVRVHIHEPVQIMLLEQNYLAMKGAMLDWLLVTCESFANKSL